MDNPTTNKAIGMLLQAFPDQAVIFWLEGSQHRAGLLPKPRPDQGFTGKPSECRSDPHLAAIRLHEIFHKMAETRLEHAQLHLSDLTRSPFAAGENGGDAP